MVHGASQGKSCGAFVLFRGLLDGAVRRCRWCLCASVGGALGRVRWSALVGLLARSGVSLARLVALARGLGGRRLALGVRLAWPVRSSCRVWARSGWPWVARGGAWCCQSVERKEAVMVFVCLVFGVACFAVIALWEASR